VHNYLRISLTDNCNLNCTYCNPNGSEISKFHNSENLINKELLRLIKIFVVNLEFTKVRLTGGEPLARKNIMELFKSIRELKTTNPFDLGITTKELCLAKILKS